METETKMYPYPPSAGSAHPMESDHQQMLQEINYNLEALSHKRQKLLSSFQSHPYQRNEIESQLQVVNRDIQYYLQQQQSLMSAQQQPPQYAGGSLPITPTGMDNPGFPQGNGHGNKSSPFMSPVDSAIGTTGMNTENHSTVGDSDDLDHLPDDVPPNTTIAPMPGHQPMMQQPQMGGGGHNPSFAGMQNYGNEQQVMHTTSDRVRMTVFPDPSNDNEDVPGTQIMHDRQTNLQKMTQPAQVLRAALQNLVNYQSSTELTAKALPEIVAQLGHQDQTNVIEASKLIHELSKKEPSLQAIVADSNAVRAIIHTLANLERSNPEIQKPLSGTVFSLSSNKDGLIMIYNVGGIPFLVRLLTTKVDAVLFYAITTIHNMLLHHPPAKMDVRLAGGLEKMVALLVKDNVKFLAIAADCLHILAYGHQDSKLIILTSNGPSLLVRVMKIYSYEKLLWTVTRLLKALSVCSNNKVEIVNAGGMQVLAAHLGHKSNRIVQNLLLTLRNLSDAATKQDNLDELLRHLVGFLSNPDLEFVMCSAGALSNLTCNNKKNKTIVCQLQGAQELLKVINNIQDKTVSVTNNHDKTDIKTEAMERCVCTLRHITSRHPGEEMARHTVRELNGIPMLMNLLHPQTRWQMIKALIGLFHNLAMSRECHTVLREQGCIPKLWQLLNRALQESQRRSSSAVSAGIVDNVSMGEVVESSTSALHLLAKDPYNRIIMRQLNVIPTFVQLLYFRNEGIQRAAVGALSELATDQEGAEQIERENANVPLTELLHSTNEGIAAYAAAILFCLSEDTHHLTGDSSNGFKTESLDSHGIPNIMPQNGNPMLNQTVLHRPGGYNMPYSNPGSHPGSVPGSQPFTPNMSEPPSGLMTPHSEFELPLDFDEFGHSSGFRSGHHSGIHTPNHPHSGVHTPGHPHSGVHTPNHPHSGIHTPASHPHSGIHTPNPHSGVHTPHSGIHTPNHYPMSHHSQPHSVPMHHQQQPHSLQHAPAGYHHIQQASYNPPSPALMDTGGGGGSGSSTWLDTEL